MNDTLQSLMQEATRLTQAGRLMEATHVIQRALGVGGDTGSASPLASNRAPADAGVLDGCVVEMPEERGARSESATTVTRPDVSRQAGSFNSGSFDAGSRALEYRLYVPPAAAGRRALPLVVMLHGCTQDPDDFAAGTGMNEAAREEGFYVLYPAQSQSANAQRCWNWFKHNHHARGQGEPALIAGMTRHVMATHSIDARRVYIAGLSAGGAMAAIVAQAYPDLFAAVGVHSGLPVGAASNLNEALSAMKNGAPESRDTGASSGQRSARAPSSAKSSNTVARPVPVIVFHGDEDSTVHQRNGEQLVADALAPHPPAGGRESKASGSPRVESGVAAGGRRYTRSVHAGSPGMAAEHWVVHGAGHAWSGGRAAGSYTDAKGPDATHEMLRFFFEHPHAGPGTDSA